MRLHRARNRQAKCERRTGAMTESRNQVQVEVLVLRTRLASVCQKTPVSADLLRGFGGTQAVFRSIGMPWGGLMGQSAGLVGGFG